MKNLTTHDHWIEYSEECFFSSVEEQVSLYLTLIQFHLSKLKRKMKKESYWLHLMAKVDSMQEQMRNVSREKEILRTKEK